MVAEYWILVLSAASLVIGLATYGKRVTRVVGKELAKVRSQPLSYPSATLPTLSALSFTVIMPFF